MFLLRLYQDEEFGWNKLTLSNGKSEVTLGMGDMHEDSCGQRLDAIITAFEYLDIHYVVEKHPDWLSPFRGSRYE